MPINQLNLTEETIKAIKEDIQRGLSPKKICMKYRISPAQYAEIKDSMKQKELLLLPPNSLDNTILSRTHYVSPYIEPTRNRHWGLILFTVFVILLIYSIYLVYFGLSNLLPTLVILVLIILIVVLASFINED
jgi:hypothetical protein